MGNGTLYICGTPIGNLEDISLRTLRLLKEADVIAAEDTRHTIKLLNYYDIHSDMMCYQEHNKSVAGRKIVEMLKNGKDIALVTDSGMPGISDPGEDLVRLCIENGIPVTASPGPTAAATALVLSGLPAGRFIFEGFLPLDGSDRKQILNNLTDEMRTVIFYVAPHHLKKTLVDIYSILGNRKAALVRELTKKFEEALRGNLDSLIEHYENNEPKGEYVLIIAGLSSEEASERRQNEFIGVSFTTHVERYTSQGMDKKNAMKAVARDRGVSKSYVYARLIEEESNA